MLTVKIAIAAGNALLLYAAAQDLPPGVPSPLNADGTYSEALRYSTPAYRDAALGLLLQEANQVALDLGLDESLPIRKTNIVWGFIAPFGYAYVNKSLGNITTRKYTYGVSGDYKLSSLTVAHLEEECIGYQRSYRLPISKVDTNAACRLARKWLGALRVDIERLDKECQMRAELSAFWNNKELGGGPNAASFVPIYNVNWSRVRVADNDNAVWIQLVVPTERLLQVRISDPKYVLREPLVVTNLASLLSQTNQISGTNDFSGR